MQSPGQPDLPEGSAIIEMTTRCQPQLILEVRLCRNGLQVGIVSLGR